jgi:hypothetical protein
MSGYTANRPAQITLAGFIEFFAQIRKPAWREKPIAHIYALGRLLSDVRPELFQSLYVHSLYPLTV